MEFTNEFCFSIVAKNNYFSDSKKGQKVMWTT
jgi:hypothetical protein